ncbi:acetyltransferase [Chitinophaga sp. Mgbs1]|uniref:Acetyltransferase n=1 Tax=Chitinophaga solisilvae TaxID=1233460 RepID=A0A433WBB0_9BACT|nr:acetyltransferase [Chitinophaga solisilvae]
MSLLTKYGLRGSIRLILTVINTRLFLKPARLVRLPFEIRNRKFIKWGKGFTTGRYCRLEAHPLDGNKGECCISIGENVQLNDSVHIVGSVGVTIGNNVLMASKIFISDLNHGSYSGPGPEDSPLSIPKDRPLGSKPVTIEDNVWIGEFVSILPGVTIGKGSIIGTMSVVTKSIPPYCIAVGSPAKVIKEFNFETQKWQKI